MADPRVSQVIEDEQPVFYYDLGCPACYVVAERIMAELPLVPEWQPVLAGSLEPGARAPSDRAAVGELVRQHGLQPLRWPGVWPPDTREAMLAAIYAKGIGRAVAFSLAAFRQAFAGGRDLGHRDTVLIAAAACEMHPSAVLKGIELRSSERELRRSGDRASAAGITALPAIALGGQVFQGIGALDEATRTAGSRA
jgi:2-hydroxychromene-2-carboxylate isomerase